MSAKGNDRIPEFLCMGFQKCGTTTLFELLDQHKDIVLSRDVKEPMYYRIPWIWLLGHQAYYRKRYYGHVAADDPRLCGEINAGLTFTGCARKIAHDFPPETKLIFMMRNPVDRAYSSYKYFLARGFLPYGAVEDDQKYGHAMAFDRYVHDVLDDPVQESQIMKKRLKYLVFSQSRYAVCVGEYLRYFPKENMKFVFFEDFVEDERAVCEEIYDFIGVEEDPHLNYRVRANEGNRRAASSQSARKFEIVKGFNYAFYEFFAMRYWAPRLYNKFKSYYDRVRRKSLIPDTDKSTMLPQTRSYLERYFAEDVRGIEQLSGRSLAGIWYQAEPLTEKSDLPQNAA